MLGGYTDLPFLLSSNLTTVPPLTKPNLKQEEEGLGKAFCRTQALVCDYGTQPVSEKGSERKQANGQHRNTMPFI